MEWPAWIANIDLSALLPAAIAGGLSGTAVPAVISFISELKRYKRGKWEEAAAAANFVLPVLRTFADQHTREARRIRLTPVVDPEDGSVNVFNGPETYQSLTAVRSMGAIKSIRPDLIARLFELENERAERCAFIDEYISDSNSEDAFIEDMSAALRGLSMRANAVLAIDAARLRRDITITHHGWRRWRLRDRLWLRRIQNELVRSYNRTPISEHFEQMKRKVWSR